jgi:sulfur-carrier protein adenylyltransferase/sulfurtransferase
MQEIDVQNLKEMRENNIPHVLIDVREPYEFEMANLGGLLIPMGEVIARIEEVPREGKVIIHCRSGARSSSVIHVLTREFGYCNLYNLKGGIMAWAEEIDPTLAV